LHFSRLRPLNYSATCAAIEAAQGKLFYEIEVVGQMLWNLLYKQSALAFHYTAHYLRESRSVA